MKMTYFLNKWANKAIEEYKNNGDLATLTEEHFMLAFDKGAEMIKEIEKVELAKKYNDLEEDEIQEMLVEKVQEKIDVLMNNVEIEEASEVIEEQPEASVEEKVVAKYERGPYKADIVHTPFETKLYKVKVADAFGEKTFYRDTQKESHDILLSFAYYLIEEPVKKEDMTNLIIEHDRLEEFCATYKGKLSLNYEIERLRELKTLIKSNSIEEPIDGLIAERPYLAIQEMTVRTMHFEHHEDPTFISVIKHENLNRFLRALSHLEIKYYDVKVITDGISITHELIEKPFEEEVETMLEQRKIIPIEIRAKLNLFSRYNELLMKSLKFNLTSEEQDEYNGLYSELKLNEGNNLYELMKASHEQRNA